MQQARFVSRFNHRVSLTTTKRPRVTGRPTALPAPAATTPGARPATPVAGECARPASPLAAPSFPAAPGKGGAGEDDGDEDAGLPTEEDPGERAKSPCIDPKKPDMSVLPTDAATWSGLELVVPGVAGRACGAAGLIPGHDALIRGLLPTRPP